MITKDEKQLLIFDNFRTNKELPKFKNKIKDPHTKSGIFLRSSDDDDESEDFSEINDINSIENQAYNSFLRNSRNFTKSINKKINSVIGFFDKRRQAKRETLTLKEYFNLLHSPSMDLEVYESLVNNFSSIFETAHKHGQIALKEKLAADIKRTKAEIQLSSLNLKKFITEEQMIDAYIKLKDKKKIKLIWLHNFSRIIPEKILKLKEQLDSLGIFDNYVILTYNNELENELETAEEIAIKKDPILFGVRADSKKLYYVGDWIDEYCDLTLESLVKQLGKNSITANDLSVNLYK